jgi:flavin-dependent dehydrogenase
MARWGLLDRLLTSDCPPIDTYRFDFGPVVISGAPGTHEAPVAYAPRRTILDKLLVGAASEAGAEVREGFTVEEILSDDGRVTGIRGHSKGGATVSERGWVVIGADGRHSLVARTMQPEQYNEKPPILTAYYSYWSGLPMEGRFETYVRPYRGFAAWPTNDDLTLIVGGWPFAETEANKKDVEGNFMRSIQMAPEFAERVQGAKREARFAGTAVPNFFRKPFGPGWALVGDAGYNKDFITAQGIQDAFRDAEMCANALDESFSGSRGFEEAMGEYRSRRDQQRAAHVRIHRRARQPGAAAAAGDAAAHRCHARQPAGDGRVCPGRGRGHFAGGVLHRGECRQDLRRGDGMKQQ